MVTLGVLTGLSDGGAGNALTAFGGACRRDDKALGEVFHEDVRFQRGLSASALASSLPAFVHLLIGHGIDALGAVLFGVSIIPLFVISVRARLQDAVLRIHLLLVVISRHDYPEQHSGLCRPA